MELLKVENHEGLYRDPTTNVIINNNSKAYTEYVKRRQLLEKKQQESISRDQEIEGLKRDIAEIKKMLLDALDKR
jgi:hypothetical protein